MRQSPPQKKLRRSRLKKTVNNLAEGEKIYEAVKEAAKDREIFHILLKSAEVKKYTEGKLTLSFKSVPRGKHFEKMYKQKFEDTASNLFGKEIKVELEGAK